MSTDLPKFQMPEKNKKILNIFHSQTSKIFLKPHHINSDIDIFLHDMVSASKVYLMGTKKEKKKRWGLMQMIWEKKLSFKNNNSFKNSII